MPRVPALLLLLAAGCAPLVAAEPTFADLPTEEFTLVDGRRLVGRYDEAHGLLWLVGPANARLGVKPGDIARRRELAPGERPALSDAPLPSGAKGDGAATVSPAIVLAARRDTVAGLAQRTRELDRLILEQDHRRRALEQGLTELKERYRDLRERVLADPGPDLGLESQRSFRVRELQGEIMRNAALLRQSEDRLLLLGASRAEAFLALSRGQADLAALELAIDTGVARAGAAPAPAEAPVDPLAWRVHELEARLEALQREHDRLRRAYDELRNRPAVPAPGQVQPSEERPAPARDDGRLAAQGRGG
jgi:hypothetical protein